MYKSMSSFHLLLAFLVMVIWGVNFVVIEMGLQEIPPFFLAFSRFFLTSVPAVFFIKPPKTSFHLIVLYGVMLFALQFALLFLGMRLGMPAGLASVVIQVNVFFSVLVGILFLQEHPSKWQFLGALVAFSGIGLVGWHLGGDTTLAGFLLVIGAAMCWSLGNLASKKMGKVNMIALIVWGSLVAWPPLLLISLFFEGGEAILLSLGNLSGLSIFSILYITCLATWFGYGVWCWLLSHHPLSAIAPFTLLVPIFGILSAVLILDEPFELWKKLASFLVLSGLVIHIIGPKYLNKKKADKTEPPIA